MFEGSIEEALLSCFKWFANFKDQFSNHESEASDYIYPQLTIICIYHYLVLFLNLCGQKGMFSNLKASIQK